MEKLKKILFEILYFCHLYDLAYKVSRSLYFRKTFGDLGEAAYKLSCTLNDLAKMMSSILESQDDDVNGSKTL